MPAIAKEMTGRSSAVRSRRSDAGVLAAPDDLGDGVPARGAVATEPAQGPCLGLDEVREAAVARLDLADGGHQVGEPVPGVVGREGVRSARDSNWASASANASAIRSPRSGKRR